MEQVEERERARESTTCSLHVLNYVSLDDIAINIYGVTSHKVMSRHFTLQLITTCTKLWSNGSQLRVHL